jgi:hypothetical protein
MNWKVTAILVLLLGMTQGTTAAMGQATGDGQASPPATPRPISQGTGSAAQRPFAQPGGAAGTHPNANRAVSASAAGQRPAVPGNGSDAANSAPEEPVQHIAIATPAPAPVPWPWQDRIGWMANLLLVILGYAGILMALSLLKKMERQTQYAEAAAQAAADGAQAALLHAQAIERSERPWILVTVEPSRRVENRFMVVATNRGRGPARVLSAVDKVSIEIDIAYLPAEPHYGGAEPNPSLASIILLPGESTGIKSFSRDDVRATCGTEERFKRVERWEELIVLYGKILYQDLIGTSGTPTHETSWCCQYIHGRQNSGMEIAGSPVYNRHT